MRIPTKNKLATAIRRALQAQPIAAFSMGLAVGLGSPAANAGPEGGVVTTGTGTITQNDVTTTIDQSSNFLRVDWQSFNVAAHESVLFQQPSSSSVALNRIHDTSASQIFGTVRANGQLFLINSNGIIFGRTAQLNVGSLVASSLDVLSYDAATGHFSLGGKGGAVVNDGSIFASRGGSVSLVGSSVANNGVIVADYGVVNLASGSIATLDFFGDGLMRFEIDGAVTSGSGTAVSNAGLIQANGGQVYLTAQAAHGVFDRVINNEGIIRANRIENVGGTIRLLGPEGTVINSGTLDASGVGRASTGGTVSVLGDQVGLFNNARVDVSGDAGGGTALIGGDFQGRNDDIPNASRTFVGRNAQIDANARLAGNGGRVIVWSNESTRYEGTINARGAGGGSGGFAEVSGKELLLFAGRASLGRGGRLLLDPRNITIEDGGADDLVGDTNDDGNDNIYAFDEDDNTDRSIDADTLTALMDDGTTVTLQATDDINVNETVDASGSATAGGGLTLQAGDDISIANNISIITRNGIISITANDAGGVSVAPDGTGDFTMGTGSVLNAGNAAINISSEGNATLAALTTTGNISVTSTDGAILDDGNDATDLAGANVALAAATNIGTVTDFLAGTGNSIDVDTNGALTADSASNTGQINLNLVQTPTLAAGAITIGSGSGRAGQIILQSAGDLDTQAFTAGAVNIGASNTTQLGLRSGDVLTINNLDDLTDAAPGTLLLSGTNDILDDDAAGAARNITRAAGSLIFNSGGASGNYTLNTNVDSLAATLGNNRDLVVNETSDIAIGALTTGGDVDINATAGSILDDGDDATDIRAATIDLVAQTNIGTITDFVAGTGNSLDLDSTGAVTATATSNTAQINLNLVRTPTLANGAITLGTGTGRAGQIILQAAGNLNTGNFNAGAVDIGASNTTQLGLRSGAILTVNATDNLTDATPGTLLLSGVTDIVDDGATPRAIDRAAGSLIFNSGGAGGNVVLNTDVDSLSATVGNGSDLTVIETDAIILRAISADDVSIQATAITDDDDNTTRIVGNDLALIGTSIGASGPTGQIDTTGDTISADASSGAIFITETNGLTALTATTTDQNITVVANGAVALTNVDAGTGTADINAGGGSITDAGATSLTAASAILNAGSIGTGGNRLNTAVGSLDATTTGGDIFVTDASTLNLTANAGAGAVNVTSGTTMNVVNVSGGSAVLASTGNMTLTNLNVGGGTANLTATGGAITDTAAPSITAGALTTSSASVGTLANRLDTAVASLNATTTGNGSIFVTDAGTLDLTASAGTGAVNVSSGSTMNVLNVTGGSAVLSSTGDMTLTTLNVGGGTANLTATGGAIADGGGTSITAGALTTSSASVGTLANRLDTAVASLSATTTGNGSIFVTDAGTLDLTTSAGTGAVNVSSGSTMNVLNVAGGSAVLASTGNMTLTNLNVGGGTANLTATGGAITDTAAPSITAGALTTSSASVGTLANRLDTAVASLNATTTGNGSIFVTDAGTLDLTASAGTGAVNVSSGSTMNVLNVTGGSAVLSSTGDMTLTTLNVGGGTANLTATGGAIADGGGTSITAGALTTNSTTVGTAVNRLDTAVASLNATSAGDIFVTDQGGLDLTAAAGAGLVNVASTGTMTVANVTGGAATLQSDGDMTLNTVTTAGAISATSVTGALLDDNNDATDLSGGSVALSAATNIGTVTNFLAGTGSSIDVDTAGALTADSASNTGQINLNLVQTPTVAAGGITLGTGAGRAGQIILQSAGNLNTSAFAPGAVNIGAGNTTQLGLRSDNVLTISAAGNLADVAPGTLLLAGTIDVVDNDAGAAARALTLAAGSLIFNSGGAGGDVTLNTTVTTLDATLGNASDLTVAETDNLVLGAVSADNVRLSATGSITDGAGPSVTANTLTVNSASVGTLANRLDTAVTSIDATTTGNGSIFVNDSGTLDLTASAGTGAVNVISGTTMNVTNVTGGSAVLSSTGNMTLASLNVGGGTANLTATGGSITDGGATSVTAGALTTNSASVGTLANRLDTAVTSIDATTTGNGSIFVNDSGTLDLTASAGTGAVNVISGTTMNVSNVTGGSAALSSTGNMTLASLNVGGGTATLTATGGSITDGGATSVTAGALTANATSIGSAANRLDTSVASLNATTAGDLFVTDAGTLDLTAAAGAGVVNVTSGSTLTATSVTGGSAVLTSNAGGMTLGTVNVGAGAASLTATGGAITDGAGTSITAGALTTNSSTIGTAANRLDTAVASMNSTTTGDQFITDQGTLTLTAAAGAAGAANVTSTGAMTVNSVTGGSATLASTGNMTLGTVNVGGGAASLTATGGSITDGAATSITAGALTANAATIGSAANRLDTAVTSLNATTTGDQFVSDQGTLALTAAAGAGTVNATSTGAMTVANVTGASTTLQATGGMTVTSINVGAGAANLTTTGALNDVGGATAITAGSLTANAGSIGAAATPLNTSVNSLTASTTAGGLFIAEANAVTLNAVSAAGAGNAIGIQAGGAVTQTSNITTAGGALSIDGASIFMNAGTTAASNNGTISYIARTGDIQLSFVNANAGDVFIAAGGNLLANSLVNFTTGLDVRGGRIELRAGGNFTPGGTEFSIGTPGQGIDVSTPAAALTVFVFIPTDGGVAISTANVNFTGGTPNITARGLEAPVASTVFFNLANGFRTDVGNTLPLSAISNTFTSNFLSALSASEEADDASIDWSVFDPNVSLFGTVGQPVRLPADQLEEEEGTQVSMLLPAGYTLVITRAGLRSMTVYKVPGATEKKHEG